MAGPILIHAIDLYFTATEPGFDRSFGQRAAIETVRCAVAVLAGLVVVALMAKL